MLFNNFPSKTANPQSDNKQTDVQTYAAAGLELFDGGIYCGKLPFPLLSRTPQACF